MNIFIYLYLFIIPLGLHYIRGQKRERRKYIIITSVVLMTLVALRSAEIGINKGSDVGNYADYFEYISCVSWSELFALGYASNDTTIEVGYLMLEKLISHITSNFQIFTFLADLLFFVPFGIFLYRYSTSTRQLIFAFVFFIVLYYTHLLTAARQSYAVGLTWVAFLYFLEKKYWWVLVFMFLASTIHYSALIFALAIGMGYALNDKLLKMLHLVSIIFVPFTMYAANSIIVYMGRFVGSEKYAAYGMGVLQGEATTFIIMMTVLSVVIYWGFKDADLDAENNEVVRKLYVMAPCATLFVPLIHSNGSMVRISEYFFLFFVLLFPFAIEQLTAKKNHNLVYFAIIGFLVLWDSITHTQTYYFFWET